MNFKHKIKETYAIFLIFFFGFLLRIFGLGGKSLWMDEIATVLYSKGSLSQLYDTISKFQATPPLHYITVKICMMIRDNEVFIRAPSIIAGVLSIYFVYKLGRLLFGKTEGLIAAFFLSISTAHIHYSQEARTYSMFILFVILSLYFLIKSIKKNRFIDWLGYSGFTALSANTHYFSFLVILGEIIFVCILFFNGQDLKINKDKFLRFLLSLIGVAILFFPTWPLILKGGSHYLFKPKHPFPDLSSDFFIMFRSQYKEIFKEFSIGKLFYLNAIPFFVCVVFNIRKKRDQSLLLLLFLTLPVFLGMFFLINRSFFHIRYFLFFLPLYLIGVSNGIILFSKAFAWVANRVKKSLSSFRLYKQIAFLIVGLLAMLNVSSMTKYYSLQKQDYKGAAQYIKEQISPNDVIVIDLPDRPWFEYYFKKAALNRKLRTVNSLPELLYLHYQKKGIWYTHSGENLTKKARPHIFTWVRSFDQKVKEYPSLFGRFGTVQIFYFPYNFCDFLSREKLEKLLQNFSKEKRDLSFLAAYNFLLKDYYKAEELYNDILNVSLENKGERIRFSPGYQGLKTIAEVYGDEGKWSEAIRIYENLLKCDPEDWIILNKMVVAYHNLSLSKRIIKGHNLIRNSGFEEGLCGWKKYLHPKGSASFSFSKDIYFSGKTSAMLVGKTAAYHGGLFEKIRIKKNTVYLFSAKVKLEETDEFKADLLHVGVTMKGKHGGRSAYTLSQETNWKCYYRIFAIPRGANETVRLYPALLTGKGIVWIDDVELVEIIGVGEK